MIKYADMHSKGISLIYKYDEGHDLDFDIGLYFYEQLCKTCDDPKNKHIPQQYARSLPTMMTAIKRKQELRDEVDVNFDGRISFLEYLLYQYKDVANPADFCFRSMVLPPTILLDNINIFVVNGHFFLKQNSRTRTSTLRSERPVLLLRK